MIWPLIQRIRVVLDHLRLNPPINYIIPLSETNFPAKATGALFEAPPSGAQENRPGGDPEELLCQL